MLQGRQSRGPGLGHALHQTTDHTSLDWRLCFSISTTLHKLITLQGVLQVCSDCYTVCYTVMVLVCDSVMLLLNYSSETPPSESAECSLPISGCRSTLLFADRLCLDHYSIQWWRLYTQQITLPVTVLQPRSYHKAWDKNEKTPGKDLLLA